MIDIHSHILYGLDDGAENARASRQMFAAAKKVGVHRIVATPHVRSSSFDLARAVERWRELSPVAAEVGVRLDLGFELHWSVLVALETDAYMAYGFRDSRRILVEFSLSADDPPDGYERVFYALQRSGREVIIAHPERYRFVQRDRSIAERWRDMGCSLQLDAVCLKQAYEQGSKRTARKLYQAGVYDFYASDAHCAKDYLLFGEALDWIERHG